MEADLDGNLRNYIKAMPSLPVSVSKVLELCNRPNTVPADLNHVISLDPVLVGRVLKLINSAYYGLGKHITSLTKAIIFLGMNTVKNLALSAAVMGALSKDKAPGLDMRGFWRHSLCVGVLAKALAKKRGIDAKLSEEYFTAGLLHDIGKIPLNAIIPDEYLLTTNASETLQQPLFQVEETIMGLTHCNAGLIVCDSWKLSGAVRDSIVHHHNYREYTDDNKDVLYSVVAANWFASSAKIGFSGNSFPEPVDNLAWEALAISSSIFDELASTAHEEIEKAEVFLRIN